MRDVKVIQTLLHVHVCSNDMIAKYGIDLVLQGLMTTLIDLAYGFTGWLIIGIHNII